MRLLYFLLLAVLVSCTPKSGWKSAEDLKKFLVETKEFLSSEDECGVKSSPPALTGSKMIFGDSTVQLQVVEENCRHTLEMDYTVVNEETLTLSGARTVDGNCPSLANTSSSYIRKFSLKKLDSHIEWTHLSGAKECRRLYFN